MKQLRLHAQIVPVDFSVENPHACKTDKIMWSSTSFYSHSQGYKLQLKFLFITQPVAAVESYCIGCCLVPGEFDDLLKWPLKAVMKLKLLCQQAQGDDYEKSIELKHNERLKNGAKEVDGICGGLAIEESIVDQYIHNSYLHIKIISVHFQ